MAVKPLQAHLVQGNHAGVETSQHHGGLSGGGCLDTQPVLVTAALVVQRERLKGPIAQPDQAAGPA